jgi:Glycosyltransferase like family
MISVLILSYRPHYYKIVEDNIKETIGVPYELIQFDNQNENIGITKAYNILAEQANYNILCFIHEDVIFHTKGWGHNVIKHLTSTAGLIGLAGSKHKSPLPTGWTSGLVDWDKSAVQHSGEPESRTNKEGVNYVSVIDGVFMATTKDLWDKVKFDENQEGFHFYDIDFSLRMNRICKVAVIFDISLEHFSVGNFGDDWISHSISFHRKHKKDKTFFYAGISRKEKESIRDFWYQRLRKEKILFKNRVLFLLSMGASINNIKSIINFFHLT